MIKQLKSFRENIRFADEALHLAVLAPYYLIFKTTNYCWYKCPHCCEKAGPDQEKTFIPKEQIFEILSQAKQDPLFIKEVVFTGGEIFSSYKFGDKQYIPQLLNFAIKNKIGADIKTNAGWANTSFGKQIFDDLREIIINNEPKEYELPKFQISLSLDKYHTNCFENNLKVVQELAGLPVMINLSSFVGQENLVKEFEKQIKTKFKTKEMSTLGSSEITHLLINNKTLYCHHYANLFNGGRAAQLPNALDIKYPQFTFIQFGGQNPLKLVAFDNFGRVTLGENSGRKIMTPYIDEYKQLKSLPQIKKDLNKATLNELLYFALYEQFFNPISR